MRRVLLVIALLAVLAGAAAWTYGPSEEAARQNRFDSPAAWGFLKQQVALGPRPADALRGRSRVREAEALTDPAGLGAFSVVEWTRR